MRVPRRAHQHRRLLWRRPQIGRRHKGRPHVYEHDDLLLDVGPLRNHLCFDTDANIMANHQSRGYDHLVREQGELQGRQEVRWLGH